MFKYISEIVSIVGSQILKDVKNWDDLSTLCL